MTFVDRISSRDPLPDLAPLRAQYALLCAQLLAAIAHPDAALTLARRLRRHVRKMVQASQAHFRYHQKTAMLLHPNWRERVIGELGGWKRLRRWTQRQTALNAAHSSKAYQSPAHPVPDAEEAERRVRMRELMKANIHPRILRDPCRMDFDAWFRLPPQSRLKNPINEHPQYCDYDYDFDPRPKADFTGIKTPIRVWPEEFKAAAEVRPVADVKEEDVSPALSQDLPRHVVRVINFAIFTTIRQEVPDHVGEQLYSRQTLLYFHVRAPPRIRGSPNFALRQLPLGGALSPVFDNHSS